MAQRLAVLRARAREFLGCLLLGFVLGLGLVVARWPEIVLGPTVGAELAPPSGPNASATVNKPRGGPRREEPPAAREPPLLTPAVAPAAPPAAPPDAPLTTTDLDAKALIVPVLGAGAADLRDSFAEGRVGHRHEAIDIMAPRNTPVVAVEAGTIAKLFTSVPGGLTIYQFDPTTTYAYYYAHLEGYAPGLAPGAEVTAGQVIGFVGTSGNAAPDAPHLHFAIYRLGATKRWWEGSAINPYFVLRAAALR